MKKTIYALLTTLVFSCLPVHAYEYFTIYFSDGTKSEAFYATDVDSICYSKLSLDSIAYDDWQVQEIYTCDSVYRYPLAQIDSLSFKDVDENKVAEDLARVSNFVDPLFVQCRTITEISQSIPSILKIEGVENVWVDNQTLFVKIKNWGPITYTYPIGFSADNLVLSSRSMNEKNMIRQSTDHSHIDGNLKACIYDQTYRDDNEDFRKVDPIIESVSNKFENMGISCFPADSSPSSFFSGDIFNYDLIFLITHGEYDATKNLHWIYTSEEISVSNDDNIIYDVEAWIKFFMRHPSSSSDLIGVGTLYEIRNSRPVVVHYVKVSNRFIMSSKNKFSNYGKTMVFNIACKSLEGPGDKMELGMANAFLNKGAACYLGYTDTNGIGPMGGEYFFAGLLNGMDALSSYKKIPSEWVRQDLIKDGNVFHPVLKIIPESSLCITHPETLSADNDEQSVTFKGQIKMINTEELVTNHKYGFQYSTNSDMSQAKDVEVKGNYDPTTLYMNWEATLEVSTLQPGTTYYYRAYMYDGYSNCYGEVKEIAQAEPYAVLKDGVLTFYYDGNMHLREGKKYEIRYDYHIYPWLDSRDDITQAVIDSSFVDYTPTSTAYWFNLCSKITHIDGLNYLNTSNVTDMSSMFCYCSSLTSLDVSSFNTANVTNMRCMFTRCSSLTSLDVSSFNTANVTDMWSMFSYCSSLTSLDLSNFNTANVTDMGYMFYDCSSLISLDLSSFNTANVTNMGCMFDKCSSLKTIYAGNWNCDGDSTWMFYGCYNLVGGQGTKVGKNLYGYDINGNPLYYYYCPSDGRAAHIDGGKSNPGLFTAK